MIWLIEVVLTGLLFLFKTSFTSFKDKIRALILDWPIMEFKAPSSSLMFSITTEAIYSNTSESTGNDFESAFDFKMARRDSNSGWAISTIIPPSHLDRRRSSRPAICLGGLSDEKII